MSTTYVRFNTEAAATQACNDINELIAYYDDDPDAEQKGVTVWFGTLPEGMLDDAVKALIAEYSATVVNVI